MPKPKTPAFTLVELLVVMAVIAVLAGVALPIYGSVQVSARKVQSLNTMRQLGIALLGYCADQNGAFPSQGDSAPSWVQAAATSDTEMAAWYNALPRQANSLGAGDYQSNPAGFYAKGSLLYVPSAKYPATKLNAPLFAIAYNSKLYGTIGSAIIPLSAVRLQNIANPASLCIFQESGLSGETKISSNQSSYNGQPASFASRSVTRYNGQTILVMADGHAGIFSGSDIVDKTYSKGAYFPQSKGKVYWTMDPTLDANQ